MHNISCHLSQCLSADQPLSLQSLFFAAGQLTRTHSRTCSSRRPLRSRPMGATKRCNSQSLTSLRYVEPACICPPHLPCPAQPTNQPLASVFSCPATHHWLRLCLEHHISIELRLGSQCHIRRCRCLAFQWVFRLLVCNAIALVPCNHSEHIQVTACSSANPTNQTHSPARALGLLALVPIAPHRPARRAVSSRTRTSRTISTFRSSSEHSGAPHARDSGGAWWV
jgi:hypothetical protein